MSIVPPPEDLPTSAPTLKIGWLITFALGLSLALVPWFWLDRAVLCPSELCRLESRFVIALIGQETARVLYWTASGLFLCFYLGQMVQYLQHFERSPWLVAAKYMLGTLLVLGSIEIVAYQAMAAAFFLPSNFLSWPLCVVSGARLLASELLLLALANLIYQKGKIWLAHVLAAFAALVCFAYVVPELEALRDFLLPLSLLAMLFKHQVNWIETDLIDKK